MIYYYVQLTIDTKVQTDWIQWMMETHIPEVVATGHFEKCYFQQIIDPLPTADKVSFLVIYECESLESLRKYSENDAPRLMEEHEKKFGGSFSVNRFVGAPLRIPEGKVKF
jgi:hypothetical protein